MSWIDAVVSKLEPKPAPLDYVTANGLLPLHNLMREARGLQPETAAEWQAAFVPLDPELRAELLDAASSAVAAEEAELRAELGTPDSGTPVPRNSEQERNSARNSGSVPPDLSSDGPVLRVVDQHGSEPSHNISQFRGLE